MTVISDYGVRLRDLSDGRAPSEDLSGYRVVYEGDLVVNKMWARFGAYGVAEQMGIISPAYWVLASRPEIVYPRFLHHLLRSSPYRAEIWRRSKDLPPNGFDLPWDQFRTITVPVPALPQQRAIADYLDRETSHIDALIAAKQRMVGLLEKRWRATVQEACWRPEFDHVPLRRFIERVEQGWSPECIDRPALPGEWAVLKVSALRPWTFIASENKALPEGAVPKPGLQVRDGDLLVGRASGSTELVGCAAIARDPPEGLMLSDKTFRLTIRPQISPAFLVHALNSATARAYMVPRLTGVAGTAYNVPMSLLLGTPMPNLNVESQLAIASDLDELHQAIHRGMSTITMQVALLDERRRALITAAVTGHSDIPEAA